MTVPGMHGPYPLTREQVDATVLAGRPGAYALGRLAERDSFVLEYVGRSDDDLHETLRAWAVGAGVSGRWFVYSASDSAQAAFETECATFHDFRPPQNRVHPGPPLRARWRCPRCDAIDDMP